MEDIFYRQMPHSLEAEQSVLGSMLIDANCVKDVMEQLRPDDFYLKQNREIFETIYSMFVYSKPIDGVTVAGEMEKNGTFASPATACASNVLPVPGGPTSKAPFGREAPISAYFDGLCKKSTISERASFASSCPATSSKVLPVCAST